MSKQFSLDELKELTKPENIHLLIHGKVYDVAKFIEEHPGGDEVLLTEAGKDATDSFEDVGHSDEARELMEEKFLVGTCSDKPSSEGGIKKQSSNVKPASKSDVQGFSYLLPLAALFAYFAYRFFNHISPNA